MKQASGGQAATQHRKASLDRTSSTGPGPLVLRYPFASDFLFAIEAYYPGGVMAAPNGTTWTTACPACKSKALPEEESHRRFPLVVNAAGVARSWRLSPTCGCSEEGILYELTRTDDVDGVELLEEIKGFIGRFMVLPSEAAADLLAEWVVHTHALDAAHATPYLRITSATPASGKSLLLEILALLCPRGWYAVNPSVAVLYRKIDRDQPTLLLDEMDNYPLDDRAEALAVLNTGYKRGAKVDRCAEKGGNLVSFSAFCPKAYAGLVKGKIPEALLSRSITIRLDKKLEADEVEMFIGQWVEPDAVPLRERCEAWAAQNIDTLMPMRPVLPPGMFSRSAEMWIALLNIAELIGGDWPARTRTAWKVLSTGGDEHDERSDQVQLLIDIRDALGDDHTIATTNLCNHLNGLEESPWGERLGGKGIDPRGLARMLGDFKIRPKTVRVGDKTLKGYHVGQFEDSFARYLPKSVTSVTSVTTRSRAGAECDGSYPSYPLSGPGESA